MKKRFEKKGPTGWGIGHLGAVVAIVVLMAACQQAPTETAAPTEAAEATIAPTESPAVLAPERGQATVDSIQVLVMESFPVQVSVVARGELPDSCTQIDEVFTQQEDELFRVVITTFRPQDAICTQALVPFEQSIALDVEGLPAGAYTVSVNGVTGAFTLDIDNSLDAPVSSEEPTAAPGGIGGRVWHDLCGLTGAAVTEDLTMPNGCVASPDGATVQANGVQDESEPGILGVQIMLLVGDCTEAQSGGEIVAETDEAGRYLFEDMSPDTYCVFLDTADEQNSIVLEEGIITSPVIDGVPTNSVTVGYDGSTPAADIDFGYDFRFRPLEAGAADCVNSFEFVQDLTVPDDTVFPPAAEFSAAWRLRNNGSCPWTSEYGVIFVGGDAMGITGTVPLENPVAPGQTADVAVDLVAPETEGTYRSNWQLSDAGGQAFGINGIIEDAFWVQIVVEEGAELPATPSPGSAAIGGVVWDDVCFINTNGLATNGCVETEEGSGFWRGDGSYAAGEVPLPGITVVLGRGACSESGAIAPADRLATAVTDEEGRYIFEGLEAAIYCVAIDALSVENVDLLIPGNWTYPAPGTGRAGLRLSQGEQRLTVDFGWDFQE